MTAIKLDSSNRVKPHSRIWVALFFSLPCFMVSGWAYSAEQSTAISENLPEIEARTFSISIERKSRSGKTYLFNDIETSRPPVGRILLLKTLNDPIVAIRVLKQYPGKKQFAGRAVKKYGRMDLLNVSQSYMALEKLSDITAAPVTETEQKEISELEGPGGVPAPLVETPPLVDPLPPVPTVPADAAPPAATAPAPPITALSAETGLQESLPPLPVEPPSETQNPLSDLAKLEGEPPPPDAAAVASKAKSFDEELDSGSSPQPQDGAEEETQEERGDPNVVVEETPIFDPYVNSLSFAFGFYRVVANGAVQNPAVGGFRFGKTIGNNILVRRPNLQDSFTIEGSLYFYKALNLGSTNADDAYFVSPLAASGRYNLFLSETFSFFVYAGLQKGFVLSAIPGSTEPAVADGIFSDLSALGPALGLGLFFQVGPNWDFRVDVGYEMIGLGLMLRF